MADLMELRWPQTGQGVFTPDARQRAVIEHTHGHLRVFAGPGTGKTSVIVESVHERIRAGQQPGSILVLTYGRMAAEELRQRLVLGDQAVPVATTFHALAHRLLQAESHPPRVMAAPEQDAVLRNIVRHTEHLPAELEAARHSRGLAEQLRNFILRAQSEGLAPSDIGGPDAFRRAAAAVYAEYLDIIELSGGLDYAGLIRSATVLIRDRPAQAVRELRTIFVDEYQDTDPSQVSMLKALAAGGAQIVAVGDPDQSIYGFRGADATGILRFDEVFSHPDCRTIALDSTRRFGREIAEVARRVVPRNALGTVPVEQIFAHRNPRPLGPEGHVAFRLYESEAAQAEHIADVLRRVHAGSSQVFPRLRLDWSQMAVLVRSGTRDMPAVQRALVAAGIPVEMALDDIPVASAPSVQPLLDVLRVAADVDGGLTAQRALSLLESPLAGLDQRQVTELGRGLRRRAAEEGSGPPPPSSQLVVEYLRDPREVAGVGPQTLAAAIDLARMIETATARVAQGWTVSQILNEVWGATNWPRRLRAEALGGGRRARTANLSLDAVVELFELAGQSDRSYEAVRSVAGFLDQLNDQAIPGAPNQQRGWNRNAVRLVTAHRSKGSQWPLVVVAGVQEGMWPDLRRRQSMFDGELPQGFREEQMLEERRLFYVACTRASRGLLITAASSDAEDGPSPSAFVTLAAGEAEPERVPGRPLRPLTPVGVVARLRSLAQDSSVSAAMRSAARSRLETLSTVADEHQRPIFPWADSRRWWGHRDWTDSGTAWFDPDEPLRLSASSVEQYVDCPRKWFLDRHVRASATSTTKMAFGNLLHLCAQAVANGNLDDDEEQIGEVLDSVWHAVGYEPGWQSRYEREEARLATKRLLAWLRNSGGEYVDAEKRFEVQLTLDGDETVIARGVADRIDRVSGQLLITDYKTGSTKPSGAEVAQHIQLGLYRWAAELGALGESGRAIAQLLYLRHDPPVRQPEHGAKLYVQDAPDVQDWLSPVIASTAAGIRAESAVARPGSACRTCHLATSCPAQAAGMEVRP